MAAERRRTGAHPADRPRRRRAVPPHAPRPGLAARPCGAPVRTWKHVPTDAVPHRRTSFVAALAAAQLGTTFNQYAASPLLRRRLRDYLDARASAPILLVGEAAGWRGARVSGLPFTSERQLTGSGPAEASATIVQRTLAELGAAEQILLWNLVPTHPHRPGEPRSNRPPSRAEIDAAAGFLSQLLAGRRVLAVGRLAHERLGGTYIRHPSHGGASEFHAGLAAALA